jgi:hypothetical protein
MAPKENPPFGAGGLFRLKSFGDDKIILAQSPGPAQARSLRLKYLEGRLHALGPTPLGGFEP